MNKDESEQKQIYSNYEKSTPRYSASCSADVPQSSNGRNENGKFQNRVNLKQSSLLINLALTEHIFVFTTSRFAVYQ